MPTKPISDRQRIITYASRCDEKELTEAIETLQAIRAGRFPNEPKRAGRKAKAAKGTPVQQSLTDEPTSEQTARTRRTRKHEPDTFTPDPEVMRMIDENKAEAATGD